MFDVVTIGSSTIDVYISTNKKMYHLIREKNKEEFCFDLGTKIEIVNIMFSTGGAGTNSAVCLKRLGLDVAYLGKLGKDNNAKTVLKMLNKEKVKFIGNFDAKHMTGYSVILDAIGHDRTVLTYKGANDYLTSKDVDYTKINSKWIYLGSMLNQSFITAKKIVRYAKSRGIKILFNPSSYQARLGLKKLSLVVKNADILIMNKEEAQYLLGKKDEKMENLILDLQKINKKIAIITNGSMPAYCSNGNYIYIAYPRKVKIVETTGAGDAFASSFLAGIIKENDIVYALRMALINSESVITHQGAKELLLNQVQMKKKLNTIKHKITKKRIQNGR